MPSETLSNSEVELTCFNRFADAAMLFTDAKVEEHLRQTVTILQAVRELGLENTGDEFWRQAEVDIYDAITLSLHLTYFYIIDNLDPSSRSSAAAKLVGWRLVDRDGAVIG